MLYTEAMKTPHLPSFPHIKKHLLIIIGIALVTAVVLAGLAEAVHEKRVADVQAAHDAQVQAAKDKATQATIDGLKAQNAALVASNKVSCDYLSGLTLAKATKSLVIVPTGSNCPNPKQ